MEKREVKVLVTRERLAKGIPCKTIECPVALGINEHLRPGYRARIYSEIFVIEEAHENFGYRRHSGNLPMAVNRRILRIDRLKPVAPFRFTLAIPVRFLKGEAE